MADEWLEAYREFLPTNIRFAEQAFGELNVVRAFVGDRLWALGFHGDRRLAKIACVSQMLERSLPQRLMGDDSRAMSWAFAPSEVSARTAAIMKGIERWAWITLQCDGTRMAALDAAPPSLKSKISQVIEGHSSLTAFQAPLSFFEPNTGIHQLTFSTAILRLNQYWLAGYAVTPTQNDPWVQVIERMLWNLEILIRGELIEENIEYKNRVTYFAKANPAEKFSAQISNEMWPPFRLEALSGKEIVPSRGYLFWSRVEGQPALETLSEEIFFR